MSAGPRPQIPPPPPSWGSRLRAWLRRQDRAGRRLGLLIGAALGGAFVAWLLAALLGLWLQPRFTVLELGAQRLAPDAAAAQPPEERLGPYGAFDRGYAVRFPTPRGGLDAVIDNARRLRWRLVARPAPDTVLFERGGVAARIVVGPTATTAETRVASWVRTRQRQARTTAGVLGGLIAAGWVWRQIRRRPRPVR